MDQNISRLKHSAVYGLLTGGIVVLYQFILFVFGMLNNQRLTSITTFFIIIGLFISVKHFRDRRNDGYLDFKRAWIIGILTSVSISLVMAIFIYFQYKFLSRNLLDQLKTISEERLLKFNMSEEMLEEQARQMQRLVTPAFVAFSSFFGTLILGILYSLVTALIMRRSENPLLKDE